jgi:hypothetical protein
MRIISILMASAVSFGFVSMGAVASATPVGPAVLCTEDSVTGCVQQLPVTGTTITVASDGEAPFDPFGAGYDTSDGVQLDGNWTAVGGWTKVWQNIGNNTWVLPACVDGSCENGEVREPRATWVATGSFSTDFFQWSILEAGGKQVSDLVTIGNNAQGAYISFASNVPEPAAWATMILGLGALGFIARRRPRALAV